MWPLTSTWDCPAGLGRCEHCSGRKRFFGLASGRSGAHRPPRQPTCVKSRVACLTACVPSFSQLLSLTSAPEQWAVHSPATFFFLVNARRSRRGCSWLPVLLKTVVVGPGARFTFRQAASFSEYHDTCASFGGLFRHRTFRSACHFGFLRENTAPPVGHAS